MTTRCILAPNILDPATVHQLVEKLTSEETHELEAYASAAGDAEDFVIRTSSWLIRRFGLHTEQTFVWERGHDD